MPAKKKTKIPLETKDKKGRTIVFRPYMDPDYSLFIEMYDRFEPKGLESGLPPLDRSVRIQWIDRVLESFFNIIALHKNRIIGHAALDIKVDNACPEYLIFISQEYRYAGIGTMLSEIMKDIACQKGCRKLWLTVRTGNTIAIRLFKKVGFEFVGSVDIQREMELSIKKQGKQKQDRRCQK